ncbi:MAG: amidase domain-containing protein, partial [bacterium]
MKFKIFRAIVVLSLFLQSFCVFAYDRQQAVKYADKWTSNIDGEKRNPAYHDYSDDDGDCSNYISQCLRDGKIRFDSKQGYVDDKGCLIRAGELPGALRGYHGVSVESTIAPDAPWPDGDYHLPSFAKKGDVISLSVPNKSYFHSAILVEVSGDKGKIDCHTNDRKHFDIDWWGATGDLPEPGGYYDLNHNGNPDKGEFPISLTILHIPDSPIVKRITLTQEGKTIYKAHQDPNAKAQPIVDISKPAKPGEVKVEIIFDTTMETENLPVVTFGKASPYNAHTVEPDKGLFDLFSPWKKTNYDNDTWKGKFTIPKDKPEEYDGTNTISIFARGEDKSKLDKDEDLLVYNAGTDILHQFTLDTTPSKPKKTKVLKGKKDISGNIVDATTVYSKDYETNQITSKPMVDEGSYFVEITFDESLDTEIPLNVSFTGSNHPVSFLSWSNTNTTWYGEFVIPRNSEYQGTHTLSISDATDLAGNTFDSDPTTEQIDPDTSNQFYVFLTDALYVLLDTSATIFNPHSFNLLNIEKRESINISGKTTSIAGPKFFPDGEYFAYITNISTTCNFEIIKTTLDMTDEKNLTNSLMNEYYYVISNDGKKIFFDRRDTFDPYSSRYCNIFVLDLEKGTETNLTNTPDKIQIVSDISPDDKKLLYKSWITSDLPKPEGIWIMNTDGSDKRRLVDWCIRVNDNLWYTSPDCTIFSPLGGKVFFTMEVSERISEQETLVNTEVFSIEENGENLTRLTFTNDVNEEIISDISPDGKRLLLVNYNKKTDECLDLSIMNTDGTGMTKLTKDPPTSQENFGVFLNDGRIILGSNRANSGVYDLYLLDGVGGDLIRLTEVSSPYSVRGAVIRPIGTQTFGNLKGRIGSTTGTLEGVMVEVLKDDVVIRRDMTNKDGIFNIENVKTGIYTVKTELPGYSLGIKTITIEKDKTTEIQLTLNPIGETGGKVAVVKDDGIWQENADGTNPRKLWEDGSITDVCLSEDGNKILYCSNKEGNYDIYLLDIPSLMLVTFHSPEDEISARFAPDERILFVRAGYDSHYIW